MDETEGNFTENTCGLPDLHACHFGIERVGSEGELDRQHGRHVVGHPGAAVEPHELALERYDPSERVLQGLAVPQHQAAPQHHDHVH